LAGHHDHAQGRGHEHGRDPVAEAEAHCASRGLKLTDMRRHVFEALARSPQAMGAYDLIDALAAAGHKRLAPISVYRALDFLLEAGLAHKIQSRNAFVACPHLHGAGDVVIFMICESCGRVRESTSDDVSAAVGGVALANRFTLRGQVIELQGRCAACADAGETMTA